MPSMSRTLRNCAVVAFVAIPAWSQPREHGDRNPANTHKAAGPRVIKSQKTSDRATREVERLWTVGSLRYKQHDYPRALSAWRRALSLDPENIGLQESVRKAELRMEAVRKLGARRKFRHGAELCQRGKLWQALPYLQDACRLDPANKEYRSYLGKAEATTKELERYNQPKPQPVPQTHSPAIPVQSADRQAASSVSAAFFAGLQSFASSFRSRFALPWWLAVCLLVLLLVLWELRDSIRTPEWEASWRRRMLGAVKAMTDESYEVNKQSLLTWPERRQAALARSYVLRKSVNELKKVSGIGPVLLGRIREAGLSTLGDVDDRLLDITGIGPITYGSVLDYIDGILGEAMDELKTGSLNYSNRQVEQEFEEEKRRLLQRQDLLKRDLDEIVKYEESVRAYERKAATVSLQQRFELAKEGLRAALLDREHTPRLVLLFSLTAVLFYCTPLWLLIFGPRLAQEAGLLSGWSGLVGITTLLVSYFVLSKGRLNLGLQGPDPQNFGEQRLQFQALRLADRLGVTPPQVWVRRDRSYNAWASGTSRQRSLVCFHSSLVKDFSEEEVEGILGHELQHLHHNDCRLGVTYDSVVSVFTALQSAAYIAGVMCFAMGSSATGSRIARGRRRPREDAAGCAAVFSLAVLGLGILFMVAYATLFVARFTARALGFAVSREAEYRADRGSAELVGKEKIISALEHLERSPSPQSIFPQVRSRLIADPARQMQNATGLMESIFATHPPLEKRIAALRAMKIT